MKDTAICIYAYTRESGLKNLIEDIKKNQNFKKYEYYFFIDYPKQKKSFLKNTRIIKITDEFKKLANVKVIKRKLVFPSSRISDRVYLGTGFRIHQAKQGYDLEKLYYNKEAFKILKKWLEIGNDGFKKSIEKILSNANQVNAKLPLFLISNNIEKTWNGLQLSSNNNINFEHQFLCWFDGLKTHRLLKYFSNYRP